MNSLCITFYDIMDRGHPHLGARSPLLHSESSGAGSLESLTIPVMRMGRVANPCSGSLRDEESRVETRVSTEVTFGRGDISVCPLEGCTGAQE